MLYIAGRFWGIHFQGYWGFVYSRAHNNKFKVLAQSPNVFEIEFVKLKDL